MLSIISCWRINSCNWASPALHKSGSVSILERNLYSWFEHVKKKKKKGTQRRNFAFKSSSWWHISVVFWIFSALGRDKGSLQKFQTNKKKEDERKPSLKSRSSLWLLPPQELDRKSSSPTSLSWGSNNICFCFSQAERIPVRRNSFPLEKKIPSSH